MKLRLLNYPEQKIVCDLCLMVSLVNCFRMSRIWNWQIWWPLRAFISLINRYFLNSLLSRLSMFSGLLDNLSNVSVLVYVWILFTYVKAACCVFSAWTYLISLLIQHHLDVSKFLDLVECCYEVKLIINDVNWLKTCCKNVLFSQQILTEPFSL